ncbi:mediator of RNA polymerase II transcription subunit 8 [Sporothrix epigloea]|uniref:Mediator of RNA polymerase II transcription subunit 8 n=1 Tax=Sporothrix epigloea TaxID=1892477 RepID=A0ABP0D932_9PEZI
MDAEDTALGLTQEDLRALDTVRARLYQLANSVQRLKSDVMMSNLLPAPEFIQASSFVLQQNLASLNEVMAQHADLFRRIVVHPDPMYPGRTEEQILTSLLRKKLEPDVEQVAERARETAAARGIGKASFGGSLGARKAWRNGQPRGVEDDEEDDDDEDDEEEEEDDEEEEEEGETGGDGGDDEHNNGPREPFGLGDIWHEARTWTMGRLEQFIREEVPNLYTKEERELGVEKVRTGLRRTLEEDDDEEEDDDDDDEDEDGKDEGGDNFMRDVPPAAPATAATTTTQQAQLQQSPEQLPAGPAAEPEVLLWLASRGDTDLPRCVEIESQRAAAAAAAQRRL